MIVELYDQSVCNEIEQFQEKIRARIFKSIDLLTIFGNRLGMPHSKALGDGLFELRIHGEQNIRIVYCFHRQRAVVLHCFAKKSQKTPKTDLHCAQQRKKILTQI